MTSRLLSPSWQAKRQPEGAGRFCGLYSLPAESRQVTTAPPNRRAVRVVDALLGQWRNPRRLGSYTKVYPLEQVITVVDPEPCVTNPHLPCLRQGALAITAPLCRWRTARGQAEACSAR